MWEFLLSFGGFVLAMLYLVTLLSSGDPLWFWPRSAVPQPSRIVIHKQGLETVLTAETPAFAPIAEAAAEAFSRLDTVNLIETGLSEETQRIFWSSAVVVEFFYDEPLQFHVPFEAGAPTQLLYPVEGPHSGKGWFFRGAGGEYWFGAMRIQDPEPLLKALEPYTS